PINVPKARRKTRSASGRSFSLNGRIVMFTAVIVRDFHFAPETPKETPFQAHTGLDFPRHKEYTTRGKCRITGSQPLAMLYTTPSTRIYPYARYSVGVVPNVARKV